MLRSPPAPSIFNRLSNARMMARHGFHAECQMGLVTLICSLHSLGFNVSWRELVFPIQRVTFLGITLD